MTKKRLAFLFTSAGTMILLLAAGTFAQSVQKENVFRYLSTFTEVFSLVRSSYVDEVPGNQLVDGAFSGVTEAIDEFSFYVPPQKVAMFRKVGDDERNGIGAVVTRRFGYALVIAPVQNSPAEKAGLEAGDLIESINGAPTQKMAAWEIRYALRGEGTAPVKLSIIRSGMTKRQEIIVQPALTAPVQPTAKQFGAVAYVKIPYFESSTSAKLGELLSAASSSGARKLIVDVRKSSGGNFEEAIKSADLFLTKGAITSLQGKRVTARKWEADPATSFAGEVLVLTDGSTGGAAEIFASALHGNQRAKLVGVTTYGKAGVQKFVMLPSGGGLQITTGYYTTPDARMIKEKGVRPDVIVDLTPLGIRDEEGAKSKLPKDDLILNKALSLLGESQMVKAAA